MALSVVVLPAPFEPSSATTCPASTCERDVGDADEVAVAHFEMLDFVERRLRSSVARIVRVPAWRRPR